MVPERSSGVGAGCEDRDMRMITDEQRRARLARRHALAERAGSVEEAVEAVTCLHATEAPTVYLSVVARSEAAREDIDRALYDDRSIVKQLAMRRTLFTFPRDVLPEVWGSASERVAQQLQARLAKEIEAHGIAKRGDVWLTRMSNTILRTLEERGPSTTAELREAIPPLARRLDLAPGKSYGANVPVAPRVIGTIAATGQILRGSNEGDWRTSRPRWTRTEEWLGRPVEKSAPESGYRELVRRWLHSFGPGTEADLVWWLGATKAAVRRALADLDAVEVALSDGIGHVLPDDVDDVPDPEPWAALLPVLDPATMGWKQRDFYLDPEDRPYLFDTNGNGGSTAWWCGRVVGCWVQDPDGVVVVVPRGDPGREALAALQVEAERLTKWLAGAKVSTVYASLQMKSATLP
jgi:winged helix DNA-binding protein